MTERNYALYRVNPFPRPRTIREAIGPILFITFPSRTDIVTRALIATLSDPRLIHTVINNASPPRTRLRSNERACENVSSRHRYHRADLINHIRALRARAAFVCSAAGDEWPRDKLHAPAGTPHVLSGRARNLFVSGETTRAIPPRRVDVINAPRG